MIIHHCLGCGKISTNRIAGDDNTYTVATLVDEIKHIDVAIATKLQHQGIRLLTQKDKQNIYRTLYGYKFEQYLR